ncbi:MAG: hypothetical protein FWC43_08615 [Planctomycetaceae bacterium]|nr:hypothetical protein [Planctomycetaceae bacterium]
MAKAKTETKAEAKAETKTKPKKKNKAGIKEFFVYHVEKLVLGGVVIVSLWWAYSGLTGHKSLPWQPSALEQAADQAKQHIENSGVTPRQFDERLFIIEYDEKATWIKRDISQVAYATDRKWEPTLFPDRIKRDTPTIFPVESLRWTPGQGAILTIDRNPPKTPGTTGRTSGTTGRTTGTTEIASGVGSGNTIVPRQWLVLTGLIPIRKQLTEYLNRYSNSMFTDPVIDTPQFLAYEIERCEYDPTPGAVPQWEKIDAVLQYSIELNEWGGIGAEQVDPSYLAPVVPGMIPMAYPLPPMVQKLYGEEVAYPPYIPLLADSLIETMEQQEEKLKQLQDFKPVDTNGLIDRISRGTVGGGASAEGRSGVMPSGIQTQSVVQESVRPPLVDHYLFRFFDFNIEGKKSYQYRVRLILKNPNHRVAPKFLEDERLNQLPVLYSDWCDPSQPTSGVRTSRVLVKDVTAPAAKRASQETSIKLLPIYFDMEDANEWFGDDKANIYPGMVANFPSTTTFNSNFNSNSNLANQQPPAKPSPTGGGGNRPNQKLETKTVNIVSDVCFLGAYGGFPVEGNSRSPAKVLLMDAGGTVVLRNLGTDLDESQNYSKTAP